MNRRDFLRRGGLGLALAGSSGAILSACANIPGFGAKTKLEMWAFASNRVQWQKLLIEDFVKEKGGQVESITVTTVPGNELYDKLQAAILANSGMPDMVDQHIYLWTRFMKDEKLLASFIALNNRIGAEKEKLVQTSALDPWTWKGQHYGIGNELNSVLLYTRTDLFAKAGIKEPVATWEDLVEQGKVLKSKGGAGGVLGFGEATLNDLYVFSYQRGGSFFDASGNFTGDQEPIVKALEFMQDLVYKHEIAGVYQNNNNPAYWGAMKEGKFACQIGAGWYQGFMKDNAKELTGKWHMQPLPSWASANKYASVTLGGTGMSISKTAANQDLAWEYIKFANLTVEGQMKGFLTQNLYPTYRPALADPRMKNPDPYFDNQKPGEQVGAVADKMAPFHTSPFFSAVIAEASGALIRLVIQPVMQNKKKPVEAIAEFSAEAKKIMSAG